MKKLAVGLQIALIGVIALVGFVLVGIIYGTSNAKLERVRQAQQTAMESLHLGETIKYNFLNARRNEKDFLIRLDEKYAAAHGKTGDLVAASLDKLRGHHDEVDVLKLVDQVKAGYQDYSKQFGIVVAMWKEAGLGDKDGLRGRLRDSVHQVETKLKDAQEAKLANLMLMMRRHEKDFLLREDPKYIADLEQRQAEFAKALEASALGDKAGVSGLMDSYVADFKKVAAIVLGIKESTKKLSDIFATAEPLLEKLIRDGEEDYNSAVSEARSITDGAFRTMVGAMIVVAAAVVGLALLIGRGIGAPIGRMTAAMELLAQGNLETEVPGRDMANEIGQMAAAVQVFKDNAVHMRRMQADQVEAERRAEEEKKAAMHNLADSFQDRVGRIVDAVSTAAGQMRSEAQSLSANAEQTSRQSAAVAAAAEEASANVQAVASATEELSSSISEISRQVTQSSEVARSAVTEAENTYRTVQGLVEAARKIGEVVNLITDIAEQTNLLALNATIEAARAGEMGKGFAVVASEVKNLANQTAKATEEIGGQIGAVQTATRDAAEAIGGIGRTVARINEVASAIAAAVEEQGAATQEIARNVEQAAAGTNEVSSNITGVTQAAGETGHAATEVLGGADQLATQAGDLRRQVEAFVKEVRGA
ncbi:MAG: methyl-accepting chemotaxis protein [Magnetospirillum sp. WYHS-4]